MNYAVSRASRAFTQSTRARKIQNRLFGGLLGGSALLLAMANRQ